MILSDEEALKHGCKYRVIVTYVRTHETYHLFRLRDALAIYCRSAIADLPCAILEVDGDKWTPIHEHDPHA